MMFSFVTRLKNPRWFHPHDNIPLLKEAEQAIGAAMSYHQGYETTYIWEGMTCALIGNDEAIWTAYEPDKELWLRMNLPEGAHVLDNR